MTSEFFHALWVGAAMMLVLEGLMPFINPTAFKKTLLQMMSMPEKHIRLFGLLSMLSGLTLLYWIN